MTYETPTCPTVGGPCETLDACEMRRLCRHVDVAPADLLMDGVKPCVHFVGFRDAQRWVNAERIFGTPDVVHFVWDQRAQREIVKGWDTVVFAKGSDSDTPSAFNFDDSNEPDDPARKERHA